ncbi:hypothetical protein SNE40_019097 [Patella caerulea]|uniref:Uncharacterized protein n=1 Tax=Patella caerulea TaxID=87958 RepID=A0AAN8J616_PATCE
MVRLEVVVVLIFVGVAFAQLDPDDIPSEWLPEQFPNPKRNPQACGLGNKYGYVCDPNLLLTEKQRLILDWLMEGLVKNDTKCPCSVWACEQKRQGYSVGIALVKKMKIPDRSRTVLDQAKVFAHYLQSTHWHYGRCEEDIVVLYSKEDEVLQFMAGKTAGAVLTNQVARAIGNHVGGHFREGGNLPYGLYDLGLLLRDVLNGNTMYALAPKAEALHGSAGSLTVFISTLIMTVLALFIVS